MVQEWIELVKLHRIEERCLLTYLGLIGRSLTSEQLCSLLFSYSELSPRDDYMLFTLKNKQAVRAF